MVTAAAQVRSFAQELPCDKGMAEKRKEKKLWKYKLPKSPSVKKFYNWEGRMGNYC